MQAGSVRRQPRASDWERRSACLLTQLQLWGGSYSVGAAGGCARPDSAPRTLGAWWAPAAGEPSASERRVLDEGEPSGVWLRSTRAARSGWGRAFSEPAPAAEGPLRGEDLAAGGGAVRGQLSLAGRPCAVLTFSASELAAEDGSEATSGAVETALGGLFVGGEARGGVGGEGGRRG